MTVKELRTTAVSMGVNGDKIEEARDSNNPQAELIALIRANTFAPAPDHGAMTVKELRGIAAGMGIDDGKIEQARDANDPRAELIALISSSPHPAYQGP
jgi:hypothetical protein